MQILLKYGLFSTQRSANIILLERGERKMQENGIQERNIAVSIILSFVTCGIYAIYWFISLTDDMGKLSNDSRLSGGKCFLFTLITCGIYGIYWAYLMGASCL